MRYELVIEIDSILDNLSISEEMVKIYTEYKDKISFSFVSNNYSKQKKIHKKLQCFQTFSRAGIRKRVIEGTVQDLNYFFFLGNKNIGYQLAQNNKWIFFKNTNQISEEMAEKYGLGVTLKTFPLIIDVILNTNNLYFRLDIDEKTTLLSILDPRNYYSHSVEQDTIIRKFNNILKKDSREGLNVLGLLFFIIITKNKFFKCVDYWTAFPSSKGEPSRNIKSIEIWIRKLMNQIQEDKRGGKGEILKRITRVEESHSIKNSSRIPCNRHFDSIILNEDYRSNLDGKTVCVLDDYSTNGTASEVCRNLLEKENIQKIYILTLGKFNKKNQCHYYKQNYDIVGDVFKKYNYNLNSFEEKYGEVYENFDEIKKLYEITERFFI